MTVMFQAEPVGDPALGKMLTMTHVPGKVGECNILVQIHDREATVYVECMTTLDALVLNHMPAMGYATGDGMIACLDEACRHDREWSQKRPRFVKAAPAPVAAEPEPELPKTATPKARA